MDFEQQVDKYHSKRLRLEKELRELKQQRITEAVLDDIIASDDPMALARDVALAGSIIPLLQQAIKRCGVLEKDARTMATNRKAVM